LQLYEKKKRTGKSTYRQTKGKQETKECRKREQEEKGKNANLKKRKPQKAKIKTTKKPSNSTNGINLIK
jgi:hypothetical protein